MRNRKGMIAMLACLWAATAVPALASDNGTVDAQVTVATPCITVGPSIDYGVKRFTVPAAGSSSYTNCSTDAETIYARGTDAVSTTSSATWQLTSGTISGPGGCIAGLNKYFHFVGESGLGGGVTLTNSDQFLNGSAAAGATGTLLTALDMPCAGSDGAGETMTFSIVLTASF